MRHCNLSYSLSTSTSTSMVVFASGLWMNCPFLNVHFIPRVSTFDVLNGGKGRRGFFELTNESRGSTENEELPLLEAIALSHSPSLSFAFQKSFPFLGS